LKRTISLLLVFVSCFPAIIRSQPANYHPIDAKATKETRALYRNLFRLLEKGVMFGHQDALAYGVNWRYEPGRSDVKEVVGQYPAVYGWEVGHIELDSPQNLDQVPFDQMRSFIRTGYEKGGVITISWHLNNPLNEKKAWDVMPGSVTSVLPGGSKHEVFKTYLDRLARFLGSLRAKNGTPVPVLFRPFHELTGDWFWWGQTLCTAEEFKQLWRFTVNYLKEEKQLHHILYVYNTDKFYSKEHFLERYPGDGYVDVVSFDTYYFTDSLPTRKQEYIDNITNRMRWMSEVAKEHNKLPAFAETGYEAIPQADWWTAVLLPLLKQHPVSYVLVWRNQGLMKESGKMHYYAPYPGHGSAADFLKFSKDPHMLFEKRTKAFRVYK
jgi:hypothetical protein